MRCGRIFKKSIFALLLSLFPALSLSLTNSHYLSFSFSCCDLRESVLYFTIIVRVNSDHTKIMEGIKISSPESGLPPPTLWEKWKCFLCVILKTSIRMVYARGGVTPVIPPPPPSVRHCTGPTRFPVKWEFKRNSVNDRKDMLGHACPINTPVLRTCTNVYNEEEFSLILARILSRRDCYLSRSTLKGPKSNNRGPKGVPARGGSSYKVVLWPPGWPHGSRWGRGLLSYPLQRSIFIFIPLLPRFLNSLLICTFKIFYNERKNSLMLVWFHIFYPKFSFPRSTSIGPKIKEIKDMFLWLFL